MGSRDTIARAQAREADPERARITALVRRSEPRDGSAPVPLTEDEAAEVRAWYEQQAARKAAARPEAT
jgi:hypothetical protein